MSANPANLFSRSRAPEYDEALSANAGGWALRYRLRPATVWSSYEGYHTYYPYHRQKMDTDLMRNGGWLAADGG